MCGGGGAGGSGTQKFEWNENIAPKWQEMLDLGDALRQRPYQQYFGQRIAGMNTDQHEAGNLIRHFVGSGGSPATVAANGQIQDTLQGKYLEGADSNPLATAGNIYSGMDSPYFRNTMDIGLEEMAQNYQNAIAPDIKASAVRAGVFGGGDHQREQAKAQEALAKQMGNYVAGMQNDQYNRSAGLEEGRIGRGTGAWEAERGRQMGALGAGQNEQALALERYRQLMGVGDIYRGHQQDFLNQGYGDWQEQKNHEYKMADWYSGLLGRAQGGLSPNMTTSMPGYSASPMSQVLGAGLLGYGMFGGK